MSKRVIKIWKHRYEALLRYLGEPFDTLGQYSRKQIRAMIRVANTGYQFSNEVIVLNDSWISCMMENIIENNSNS